MQLLHDNHGFALFNAAYDSGGGVARCRNHLDKFRAPARRAGYLEAARCLEIRE